MLRVASVCLSSLFINIILFFPLTFIVMYFSLYFHNANYKLLPFIATDILFNNNNLFDPKITGRLQLYSKLISSGSGCTLSLS